MPEIIQPVWGKAEMTTAMKLLGEMNNLPHMVPTLTPMVHSRAG